MLRQFTLFCGLTYFIMATIAGGIFADRQKAVSPAPPTPSAPAPTIKSENEMELRKIHEQLMADQLQIDHLQQQAQSLMQDEQKQAQLLTAAKKKALADAGADESKWQIDEVLWQRTNEIRLQPIPAKPDAKKSQ